MQPVASGDQAADNAAKVSPGQRKGQTTASPKSVSPSVPPDFGVQVGTGRVWLQRENFLWRKSLPRDNYFGVGGILKSGRGAAW